MAKEFLFVRILVPWFLSIYYCDGSRRITEGKDVTEQKKYMVYLTRSASAPVKYDAWICGGVIVSPQLIVTAAACVEDVQHMYAIAGYTKYVKFDEIDIDPCTRVCKRKVVQTCVPKVYEFAYNELEKWSMLDIAVASVEKPYVFDVSFGDDCSYGPNKITVNFSPNFQKPGTTAFVLGWGHAVKWRKPADTNDYNMATLQYAPTEVISKSVCKAAFKNVSDAFVKIIDKYMICADGNGSLDDQGRLLEPVPVDPDPCGVGQMLRDGKCIDLKAGYAHPTTPAPADAPPPPAPRPPPPPPPLQYPQSPLQPNMQMPNMQMPNMQMPNMQMPNVQMPNMQMPNGHSDLTRKQNVDNSRRNGICQNDHGGPLITWVGGREALIGVASVFRVNSESECIGPYLYTSTLCNYLFLTCLMQREKQFYAKMKLVYPERRKSNYTPTPFLELHKVTYLYDDNHNSSETPKVVKNTERVDLNDGTMNNILQAMGVPTTENIGKSTTKKMKAKTKKTETSKLERVELKKEDSSKESDSSVKLSEVDTNKLTTVSNKMKSISNITDNIDFNTTLNSFQTSTELGYNTTTKQSIIVETSANTNSPVDNTDKEQDLLNSKGTDSSTDSLTDVYSTYAYMYEDFDPNKLLRAGPTDINDKCNEIPQLRGFDVSEKRISWKNHPDGPSQLDIDEDNGLRKGLPGYTVNPPIVTVPPSITVSSYVQEPVIENENVNPRKDSFRKDRMEMPENIEESDEEEAEDQPDEPLQEPIQEPIEEPYQPSFQQSFQKPLQTFQQSFKKPFQQSFQHSLKKPLQSSFQQSFPKPLQQSFRQKFQKPFEPFQQHQNPYRKPLQKYKQHRVRHSYTTEPHEEKLYESILNQNLKRPRPKIDISPFKKYGQRHYRTSLPRSHRQRVTPQKRPTNQLGLQRRPVLPIRG